MQSKVTLTVWMNMPSHHQTAFFEALRRAGVGIRVVYYGRLSKEREKQGWAARQLFDYEEYVGRSMSHARKVLDQRQDAINIIPGIGERFLFNLVREVVRRRLRWCHWSEPTAPGVKWLVKYPLQRIYAGIINRHALGALAIGRLAENDFSRWGVKSEKIFIVPYSIQPLRESLQTDPRTSMFVGSRRAFLYVGRLHKQKGVELLLRAFNEISKRSEDWVLVLVGVDYMQLALQKLAVSLGIQDKILFRGKVEYGYLPSIYKCADVLVLPSLYDGWGMTVNEAASLGIPVVASSAVGSAHHLLRDGLDECLFRSGSHLDLARALGQYVDDPELLKAHGQKIYQKFLEYSPESNVERLLAALKQQHYSVSAAKWASED